MTSRSGPWAWSAWRLPAALLGFGIAGASASTAHADTIAGDTVFGTEVECGVLGSLDGPPETSRLGELRVGGDHEFYDFEAKYLPDQQTEIDIPADLPADVEERLRAMALRAFEAVSCEGLARVDFFLMPDGSVVINELNTMPGFTPTSMYPQLWAAAGLTYPQLVDRLIQLALQRDTGLR